MNETLNDQILSIHLYPIKSCHAATVDGVAPDTLEVGPTGFMMYGVRDREYVVVDEAGASDGADLFVSQRGWGANGRYDKAARSHDIELATVAVDVRPTDMLIRSRVGEIALDTMYHQDGVQRPVNIHSKQLWNAIDQGDDAAGLFTELLGRPVRLVRANRSFMRLLVDEQQRTDGANQVAGADGQPFLLVSQASLDNSHEAAGLPLGTVPIDRYRANQVMSGHVFGPYAEDRLRRVRIGGLSAHVVSVCVRCPMPNIDQELGKRVGKGLPILNNHLGYPTVDAEKAEPLFGQNLNHVYDPSRRLWVSVGDAVEALEWAAEPNFIPAA